MARLNFTFPLGWPSHTFAELDGYAEITDQGDVEEIFLPDYADKTIVHVTVAGQLAKDIDRWLLIERRREVEEAADDARLGRIAHDREVGRAA